MSIPQDSQDISLKISQQDPQEPKEEPEVQISEKEQEEPTLIKIVYVYVPVPEEYTDNPLLDYKQVMVIMGWEKSKVHQVLNFIFFIPTQIMSLSIKRLPS